ncbi:MAG: cobalamin B12-binding domain-containing protein [Deltaproteobacteria bacterium]|nr:cobalamin B12-binding domain-containing protein [Deltaproteobacteria bacterium]
MKILLIQPQSNPRSKIFDSFILHEPLGLEYVAAGVRDHHDVRILDLRLEGGLEENLKSFQPDIVGVTAFTVQMKNALEILKAVKRHDGRIMTVVGGYHATASPRDYDVDCVDVVVIGEGVFAFRDIVTIYERRREIRLDDLGNIPGIAFRSNGKLHFTPFRVYPDVDLLPMPARELTGKHRNGYFNTWMKPLSMIRTSVGCAFRCNFCLQWKMSGGKYHARDPRLVVEELASIREPYVSFADDETLLDTARMSRLADMIREARIRKKYRFFARADTVVRHPDLIRKWRDIGLSSLLVGFESYKDDDLKFLNKKTSTKTNEQAIRILQENKIEIIADFIIRQEYDEANFEELRAYVRKLRLTNPKFPILTPFPGTDLYESIKEQILTDDYDLYDLRHTILPTKLPVEKFYEEVNKLKNNTVSYRDKIRNLRNRPVDEWLPVLLWTVKSELIKYKFDYRAA